MGARGKPGVATSPAMSACAAKSEVGTLDMALCGERALHRRGQRVEVVQRHLPVEPDGAGGEPARRVEVELRARDVQPGQGDVAAVHGGGDADGGVGGRSARVPGRRRR